RAPRALPGETLGQGVAIEVLVARAEEEREPAVADLRAECDVLRSLGAEEDRDVVANRMNRRLQRLAEAGPVWIRQGVVGALVGDAVRARDDVADDLHVLARARERLLEGPAV